MTGHKESSNQPHRFPKPGVRGSSPLRDATNGYISQIVLPAGRLGCFPDGRLGSTWEAGRLPTMRRRSSSGSTSGCRSHRSPFGKMRGPGQSYSVVIIRVASGEGAHGDSRAERNVRREKGAFGPPSQFCELTVSSPYRNHLSAPLADPYCSEISKGEIDAKVVRRVDCHWRAFRSFR
jgi:hypothetical protein